MVLLSNTNDNEKIICPHVTHKQSTIAVILQKGKQKKMHN